MTPPGRFVRASRSCGRSPPALTMRAVAHLESLPAERRPVVMTTLVQARAPPRAGAGRRGWGPRQEQIEREYIEAMRIPRPEEAAHHEAVLADQAAADRSRALPARGAERARADPRPRRGLLHDARVALRHGDRSLDARDVRRRRRPAPPAGLHPDHPGRRGAPAEGRNLAQPVARHRRPDDLEPARRGRHGPGGAITGRICAHFLAAVPALLADLAPSARP